MNCNQVGEDNVTCGGLLLGDLDGDLTCSVCSRSPHTAIESAEARQRWDSEEAAMQRIHGYRKRRRQTRPRYSKS